jgi:hypothetical protein
MKSLICKIFGHQFRYNFTWMPSKAICKRCHKKWIATGSLLNKWEQVDYFDNDTRSDVELTMKWYK